MKYCINLNLLIMRVVSRDVSVSLSTHVYVFPHYFNGISMQPLNLENCMPKMICFHDRES